MQDEKVSQFPSAVPFSDADIIPVVQNIPPLTTRGGPLSSLKIYFRSAFDPVYVNLSNQNRIIPGLRLTVDSGDPVPFRDFAAQSTIFYTPYRHNTVFTYNGTRWQQNFLSEINLVLSGLTTGKNYDVFLDNDTLSLFLSNPWTNNTNRADALGTQDGITVLSVNHKKLWIGTIRASSPTTTEDTGGGTSSQVGGQRFVWNVYNQVPRFISVIDTTTSWNYTTNTIRQADGATTNIVEFVTGENATQVNGIIQATVSVNSNATHFAKVGIGLDSTTVFSGLVTGSFNAGASAVRSSISGRYDGYPGMGYHFLSWNESGADTACTFEGLNDNLQSGMTVTLLN